jgi:hypothetical protein
MHFKILLANREMGVEKGKTPSNSPAGGGGFKPSPRQRGELERGQMSSPTVSCTVFWVFAKHPYMTGLS